MSVPTTTKYLRLGPVMQLDISAATPRRGARQRACATRGVSGDRTQARADRCLRLRGDRHTFYPKQFDEYGTRHQSTDYAWNMGIEYAKLGKTLGDNPYKGPNVWYRSWRRGFIFSYSREHGKYP